MRIKNNERIAHEDVVIIIPSRIGSTRLANKALAKIGQKTMIESVIEQVKLTATNNIYVATDYEEIATIAENSGVKAIMTKEECLTGTDRVYDAFLKIPNNDKIKYIVNVQGDMPFVDPKSIDLVINKLKENKFDIITPVVKVGIDIAGKNENVNVIVDRQDKALYFSRSLIPNGGSEFLYHVGIYGFKRQALIDFIKLEQTNYEKQERLEQLRAIENGQSIGVVYTDNIPISVDTATDLADAREFYNKNLLT